MLHGAYIVAPQVANATRKCTTSGAVRLNLFRVLQCSEMPFICATGHGRGAGLERWYTICVKNQHAVPSE